MYPSTSGSAIIIGLGYQSDDSNNKPDRDCGKPLFRNVTFEDIIVESAGIAGQIIGFPENCIEGLTLRNITLLGGERQWICDHVDLSSLVIEDVYPSTVSCAGKCNVTTFDDKNDNFLDLPAANVKE
jgi:hypothetical protein